MAALRSNTLLHRSRKLRVLFVVLSVLILVGDGVAIWLIDPPTVITVDDAVARFRADEERAAAAEQQAAEQATTTTAAPAAGQQPGTAAPGAAQPGTRAGARPGATPGQPGAPGGQPGGGAASRKPTGGVYPFRTNGGGEIDALGGARHDYPPETAFTVRHTQCGFTTRWQPLDERWDEWDFCSPAGSRPMLRISTYHEFFQRPIAFDFDCGGAEMLPADRTTGRSWDWRCVAPDGSTLEGTATIKGIVRLDIGGTQVQALHVFHDTILTGANQGTQLFDWWLELETGMPVQMKRTLQSRSDSPFGKVNYREQFESKAASMTPRR